MVTRYFCEVEVAEPNPLTSALRFFSFPACTNLKVNPMV